MLTCISRYLYEVLVGEVKLSFEASEAVLREFELFIYLFIYLFTFKKKSGANLNSQLVKDCRSRLINGRLWRTKRTQDWRHKKEKPSYQSFSLMVSYQKMYN